MKKASRKDYDAICHELGFIPSVHFVEITNRGTITYTCGKPQEIRALYKAVIDHGYQPSKNLEEAAKNA